MKALARNRRAFFDYELLEQIEAGLVLKGYEVKSIKLGHMSLKGAFVSSHKNELFLTNSTVPLYKNASISDYDPSRSIKILVHKKEQVALLGKIQTEGLTLVPLSVYNKGGKIKLLFALARGKKKYDKRQGIKRREDDVRIGRILKQRQ